jgi:hypothetical protein
MFVSEIPHEKGAADLKKLPAPTLLAAKTPGPDNLRPGLSRSLLAQYLPKEFNSVLLRVIFNISNECLKLVIASAFACTRDTSAIGVMRWLKELYESNRKRINRCLPRTTLI